MDAAQTCILRCNTMRKVVPPSHHLALCVQFTTVSATVLLRFITYAGQELVQLAIQQAKFAANALVQTEALWPGSQTCAEIVLEFIEAIKARQASESIKELLATQTFPLGPHASTSNGAHSNLNFASPNGISIPFNLSSENFTVAPVQMSFDYSGGSTSYASTLPTPFVLDMESLLDDIRDPGLIALEPAPSNLRDDLMWGTQSRPPSSLANGPYGRSTS